MHLNQGNVQQVTTNGQGGPYTFNYGKQTVTLNGKEETLSWLIDVRNERGEVIGYR